MESMRIAPPIAVLGVLEGRRRDGKGKAQPSGPRMWLVSFSFSASGQTPPASRFCRNANDINDRSAIPTSLVRKGPERGEGSSPGNDTR
jgi:hypothetical protein